jgi:hypothetical protein
MVLLPVGYGSTDKVRSRSSEHASANERAAYSCVLSLRQMLLVNVSVHGREIDRGPAEAARAPGGRLRRQRQARIVHGVFPSGERALAAVLDEVGFRTLREIVFPCGFEVIPGFVEGRCIAGAGPSALRQRIESDVPSPLRCRDRQTGLDRDRADLNVTVEDVPAVGAFGVRAGMALLKRGREASANYQPLGDRSGDELQRVVAVQIIASK